MLAKDSPACCLAAGESSIMTAIGYRWASAAVVGMPDRSSKDGGVGVGEGDRLAGGVADALGDASTSAFSAEGVASEGVAGGDSMGAAATGVGLRLDARRSAQPPRTAIRSTMAAVRNFGSERRRSDILGLSDRTVPHNTPRKYRG
jgi:hypothetical protein